jgi:hypothetical protein
MDKSFAGFERSNTTPIPDALFDELLSLLSGAELKVLLYIMRRTWGFKKDTDAISLSQFQNGIVTYDGVRLDSGCGIKRRETIIQALSSLEKDGYIVSHKSQDSAGDNAVTVYCIRFKEVVSKPDYGTESGGFKTGPQVGTKPDHRGFKTGLPVVSKPDYRSPVSGPPVVSKPDPQDTDRHSTALQDTDIHHHNHPSSSSNAPDQFDASSKPALRTGNEPHSRRGKKMAVSSPEVQALVAAWRLCHEEFYRNWQGDQEKSEFVVNRTLIDHATSLAMMGVTPSRLPALVEDVRRGWSSFHAKEGLHLGSVVKWVKEHGVPSAPSTPQPSDNADALYYDLACTLGDPACVDLPSGFYAWTNREFLQVVYDLLYPEEGDVSAEMKASAMAMMAGYLKIVRKVSA